MAESKKKIRWSSAWAGARALVWTQTDGVDAARRTVINTKRISRSIRGVGAGSFDMTTAAGRTHGRTLAPAASTGKNAVWTAIVQMTAAFVF